MTFQHKYLIRIHTEQTQKIAENTCNSNVDWTSNLRKNLFEPYLLQYKKNLSTEANKVMKHS